MDTRRLISLTVISSSANSQIIFIDLIFFFKQSHKGTIIKVLKLSGLYPNLYFNI